MNSPINEVKWSAEEEREFLALQARRDNWRNRSDIAIDRIGDAIRTRAQGMAGKPEDKQREELRELLQENAREIVKALTPYAEFAEQMDAPLASSSKPSVAD